MHTIVKFISFVCILLIAVVVFTSGIPQLVAQGDIEGLRAMSRDNLWGMLLLTFLVMLLQNLLTAVPLVLLVTVNAALFGFVPGYVWSWLSSVAAASVVFLLTRYWLQSWLLNKVNPTIKERIERNGFFYVFICRLIPVMPSSLINMAAGAGPIRYSHFLISTLAGNLLFMSALAGITLGIMAAGWEIALMLLLALASVGGFYVVRKRNRRNKEQEPERLVQ